MSEKPVREAMLWTPQEIDLLKRTVRGITVEQCARSAEGFGMGAVNLIARDVAAKIRRDMNAQ